MLISVGIETLLADIWNGKRARVKNGMLHDHYIRYYKEASVYNCEHNMMGHISWKIDLLLLLSRNCCCISPIKCDQLNLLHFAHFALHNSGANVSNNHFHAKFFSPFHDRLEWMKTKATLKWLYCLRYCRGIMMRGKKTHQVKAGR